MAGRNYAAMAIDEADTARRNYYIDPTDKKRKSDLYEATGRVNRALDNQDAVGAGRGLVNPPEVGHNEGFSMTDERRRQINGK